MGRYENCKRCGKKIYSGTLTGYCRECFNLTRSEKKITEWLETGSTGYGVDTTIRGPIRKYILEDQKYKCAICGLDNKWNGKELNFILDHVNGDASNSSRENLRLICPNCDSQLETYKSRNKNSARNKRREFLKENYNNI